MALQITSIDQLDATKVDQMFQTFTQLMQERHPEVELTRGVFHDLVLYFNSVLNAAVQENIERVLNSNSLLKIQENPQLADDTIVDQVLSNYNLKRDAGVKAIGEVTVITTVPFITTIPATTTLTADEVTFVPVTTYRGLPPGSMPADDNDRVMVAVGDGTYAFNINVIATEPGEAGNIRRGADVAPMPIPGNVDEMFATTDFVNGKNPSTNADYIEKLPSGLAAKTIGGRATYAASIKNQEAFSSIKHISIIGFGDPEQHRDQHSIMPVSGGGRVDIYLQPIPYAQEKERFLEASYVGESDGGTVWQIALGKDSVPGLYEVIRIAAPNDAFSTGYQIISDIRSVDLLDEEYVPDIVSNVEGAYTKYQTAIIRFIDTETSSTGLTAGASKKTYSVTTTSVPLIDEVQNYLNDRNVRAKATDVLVKAAVPCFTTISFHIRKEAASANIDVAAIKKAIVAAVSDVGFSGQLHSSLISGVVHKYLTGRQAVSAIDMFGRIRRPDGGMTYVRDKAVLQIPFDPLRMVTGRTTAFLLSEKDIAISVVTAGFSD